MERQVIVRVWWVDSERSLKLFGQGKRLDVRPDEKPFSEAIEGDEILYNRDEKYRRTIVSKRQYSSPDDLFESEDLNLIGPKARKPRVERSIKNLLIGKPVGTGLLVFELEMP